MTLIERQRAYKAARIRLGLDKPPNNLVNFPAKAKPPERVIVPIGLGENCVDLPAQEQAEPRSSTAVVLPPIKIERSETITPIADAREIRIGDIQAELRAMWARLKELRKETADRANLPPTISTKTIVLTVAKFYDVEYQRMFARCNFPEIVRPRHIAMYLTRELGGKSFPSIGHFFGRDHSTAMNAYRRMIKARAEDPTLDADIIQISSMISEGAHD
jgi:hypothetical protein